MGVTEADYGEACPTFSDYHNSSHMELSAAVPLIAHPPPFAVSLGWHVGHLLHKNPSIWSCYHLLWALLSMFVVYSCLSLVFFFLSQGILSTQSPVRISFICFTLSASQYLFLSNPIWISSSTDGIHSHLSFFDREDRLIFTFKIYLLVQKEFLNEES